MVTHAQRQLFAAMHAPQKKTATQQQLAKALHTPRKKTAAQKQIDQLSKRQLEDMLAFQMRAVSLPFDHHKRFHPTRHWEADFILWDESIIVEVEGGTYTHGSSYVDEDGETKQHKSRHVTPTGFRDDCEKYNAANLLGFHVYRFDTQMVQDGSACLTILEAYQAFHAPDAFIARRLASVKSKVIAIRPSTPTPLYPTDGGCA